MDDLAFLPAAEQARLIRSREVSSRELVDRYLERIDRLDGALNSYVHLLADEARAEADARDRRTAAGDGLPPLHGVPVSIKELQFLAGAPATMATAALKDNVAPFDSEVVARLKRAGTVILGKTNAPELGTTPYTEPALFGACRNPWAPDRTPGGSSGGAGAALAAGLCALSQGSDGGGSIRIPASATGLVGVKPSRYRVSSGPLVTTFGPDLSTGGALTRTVRDAALALDLLSGYAPGDPAAAPPPERPFVEEVERPPGRLRIGVLTASPFGPYAAPVAAAVEATRRLLEDEGHVTTDVQLQLPDPVVAAFELIWAAMVASYPFPRETLEPLNRWLAERGDAATAGQVYAAEFQLGSHARTVAALLDGDLDLLAFPVLTDVPPPVGAFTGRPVEEAWRAAVELVGATPLVNATGQPAVSLPTAVDPTTGLPVGVQLVARYAEEATLVRVAARLEEQVGWDRQHPPGYAD